MKFLIISIYDSYCHNGPTFSQLAKISHQSLIKYCDLHGYDYLLLDKNPDESRQISWGRTFLVEKYLKSYDWILCLDVDIMIMNYTIKLEHLISDKFDLIVAASQQKIEGINTGSILWKNSEFSFDLIKKMYEDKEYAIKGYWEQSTLIKLIQNNPNLLNNIKLVSPKLINSFYHYWFPNENYQHGDFLVHLVGCDNDYRFETLKNLQQYIINPINNIQERVKIWDR